MNVPLHGGLNFPVHRLLLAAPPRHCEPVRTLVWQSVSLSSRRIEFSVYRLFLGAPPRHCEPVTDVTGVAIRFPLFAADCISPSTAYFSAPQRGSWRAQRA